MPEARSIRRLGARKIPNTDKITLNDFDPVQEEVKAK